MNLSEKTGRPAFMYDEALIDELFDDIPVQKVGFLSGVGRFFKRLFGKRKKQAETVQEAYSKFKHFYDELDKDDPGYLHIRHASTLCDDALRVATQRLKISARLNVLETQLAELDSFMNLTDEEIANLKRMLERFVALAGERSILLEKLTDYDSSLVAMEPLEEDAWQAIPSIKDAEKHQRALRMDIGYLTGEKQELIFEREDMQKVTRFINRLTVGVIGVFVVIGVVLAFLAYFRVNIFIPTTVLVLLVMAFVVLINVFRFRLRGELKRNMRKQQRAIELLNKKSVVYAYYTNFLRYCYKKYKASNSRALENNLLDLESYRHIANRIDTVRSLMYETETEIERFLRVKKLGAVKSTIEGFARTINLEDKRRRSHELAAEKAIAERNLVELDARHEEIWEALTRINAEDTSGKVAAILEAYMTEAESLFAAQKTEEEKQEERPIWKLFELLAEGEGIEGLTPTASEVMTGISNEAGEEESKPVQPGI